MIISMWCFLRFVVMLGMLILLRSSLCFLCRYFMVLVVNVFSCIVRFVCVFFIVVVMVFLFWCVLDVMRFLFR